MEEYVLVKQRTPDDFLDGQYLYFESGYTKGLLIFKSIANTGRGYNNVNYYELYTQYINDLIKNFKNTYIANTEWEEKLRPATSEEIKYFTSNVEEMTLEAICKELGRNVKIIK